MPTLILDIETVGENFDELDTVSQDTLTRWIKREAADNGEYRSLLSNLKEELGFSPLTGEIVAIGVLDAEKDKGAVYFQAPNGGEEIEENGVKFLPLGEKEMLEKFWAGVAKYDRVVTFAGRTFDIPFLMIRSAVHGIRPSKNFMSNRYRSSQLRGAEHIDLQDELSFYGAMRRKGSLHLYARAFGIASPKAEGVAGDDVARLFAEEKYLDIARYNLRDVRATKELYQRWDKYLRFG